MQQHNNIENKLRDLEAMEQPELGQMDAHWQQMAGMLQPPVLPLKKGWPKWMLNGFSAAAVVLLVGAAIWFVSSKEAKEVKQDEMVYRDTTVLGSANTFLQAEEAGIAVSDTVFTPTVSVVPASINSSLIQQVHGFGDPVRWTEQDSILATIKLNVTDCLNCPGKTNDVVAISNAERQLRLQTLFTQLEKEAQYFTIDNSKDTLLQFEEGTVLLIPAKSFGGMDGVEITAKEFYKTSDIVLNKLSTASNKEQLETGGMLYINVTYKGKTIEIKRDNSLLLFMPDTSSALQQMQLFSGEIKTNKPFSIDSTEKLTAAKAISEGLFKTSGGFSAYSDSLNINWIPQHQYFSKKRITTLVRVLNIIDQPIRVDYGPNGEDKMKAVFVISDSLAVTKTELRKILRKKFGYSKVKFKSDNRNWFNEVDHKKKNYNRNLASRIGDSVWMEKEMADQYKLVPVATKYIVNYDITALRTSPANNLLSISANNKLMNEISKKSGVALEKLGWINCDRFYSDSRKKVNFKVDLGDAATNYYTMLVFDKIKSMMTGVIDGNQVAFHNIPIGEPVKIISIGINNQGETVYSVTHTTTSDLELKDLQFQTTSVPDLRASLSKLDK